MSGGPEDLRMVVGEKKVEAQYVVMKVPLYSYGCERKMKKSLSRLRGIHSVSVDYPQQKVTVWGICNSDDVLAAVRKKRRGARFWNEEEEEPQVSGTSDMMMISADGGGGDSTAAVSGGYMAAFASYRVRRRWKKLGSILGGYINLKI